MEVLSEITARPRHLAMRPAMRLWLGVVSAVAALVGLLAAAAPSEAAPSAPAEFFGMTAVNPTEADFQRIGAAGVGSYRVEISWRSAQVTRGGPFNWKPSDMRFYNAAVHGLKPVPVIFGTPPFISPVPGKIKPPVTNGADREAWRQFVAAAVARYGPGGEFWVANDELDETLAPEDWIVWNEQNARTFWRPKANPREYGLLLRDTEAAIEGVQPGAKLVVGGMYGYPKHRNSMAMSKFLKRLYKQPGAKQAIDGVSLHPYAGNLRGVKDQLKLARKAMQRAGDGSADIWIGEIGWASAGNKRKPLVKGKKQQARLLESSYELMLKKRRRWNIRASFWFTWRDYKADSICQWCPKAGLLKGNSKPKPAFRKFKKLAR